MDMKPSKYFLGYTVSGPFKTHLLQYQDYVRATEFVKPDQLHVTALFLGNVTLDEAQRILLEVNLQYSPVTLRFKGFEVFNNSALVATLWDLSYSLYNIHKDLRSQISLPKGKVYPYTPHITIAKGKIVTDVLNAPAWDTEMEFVVDALSLFEKKDGDLGYTVVNRREFS